MNSSLKIQYILKNINEETAIDIADFFVLNKEKFPHVFLLDGEIGAGKTTFSRAYIVQKEKDIQFASPTYTLVNEYRLDNYKVNHFDLYRITTDDYDWIYEYLENVDEYFLFEWASLHLELFEEYETISILFQYNEFNTRDLSIEVNEKYTKDLEEYFNEASIIFEKCSNTSCY